MFLGLAPNRRAPKASVFTFFKKNRLLVPGLWPGARTGYHTLNSAWQLKGSKKVLGAEMEVMKRGAMRKLEVLEGDWSRCLLGLLVDCGGGVKLFFCWLLGMDKINRRENMYGNRMLSSILPLHPT